MSHHQRRNLGTIQPLLPDRDLHRPPRTRCWEGCGVARTPSGTPHWAAGTHPGGDRWWTESSPSPAGWESGFYGTQSPSGDGSVF